MAKSTTRTIQTIFILISFCQIGLLIAAFRLLNLHFSPSKNQWACFIFALAFPTLVVCISVCYFCNCLYRKLLTFGTGQYMIMCSFAYLVSGNYFIFKLYLITFFESCTSHVCYCVDVVGS